jgi:hypothetical protein
MINNMGNPKDIINERGDNLQLDEIDWSNPTTTIHPNAPTGVTEDNKTEQRLLESVIIGGLSEAIQEMEKATQIVSECESVILPQTRNELFKLIYRSQKSLGQIVRLLNGQTTYSVKTNKENV